MNYKTTNHHNEYILKLHVTESILDDSNCIGSTYIKL